MEQVTNTLVSRLADGPVELDFDQLALVGGGLPKGGWSTDGLATDTTTSALPKGGWEA